MIMASSPFVRAGSLFYPEPLREGTVFIEKVVYAGMARSERRNFSPDGKVGEDLRRGRPSALRKEGIFSHFFSICPSREQMAQEWRKHRSSWI